MFHSFLLTLYFVNPYLIGYICHFVFSDSIFISFERQSTSQHLVIQNESPFLYWQLSL